MNRVRVWLAALGVMAAAALPVSAQVQTGSILVRVTDGGVNRFESFQPGM